MHSARYDKADAEAAIEIAVILQASHNHANGLAATSALCSPTRFTDEAPSSDRVGGRLDEAIVLSSRSKASPAPQYERRLVHIVRGLTSHGHVLDLQQSLRGTRTIVVKPWRFDALASFTMPRGAAVMNPEYGALLRTIVCRELVSRGRRTRSALPASEALVEMKPALRGSVAPV
jgi:hypothetical protein